MFSVHVRCAKRKRAVFPHNVQARPSSVTALRRMDGTKYDVNPVKVRGPTGLYAREAELDRPSRVACSDLLALNTSIIGDV